MKKSILQFQKTPLLKIKESKKNDATRIQTAFKYRCITLTIDFQNQTKFQFLSLFPKKSTQNRIWTPLLIIKKTTLIFKDVIGMFLGCTVYEIWINSLCHFGVHRTFCYVVCEHLHNLNEGSSCLTLFCSRGDSLVWWGTIGMQRDLKESYNAMQWWCKYNMQLGSWHSRLSQFSVIGHKSHWHFGYNRCHRSCQSLGQIVNHFPTTIERTESFDRANRV